MDDQPEVTDRGLQNVHWVYYIYRDGLVKIGTTRQLAQRMKALRPDKILALEPGNAHTEKKRHRKFRREWQGREHENGTEWFHPSARLQRHIARLQRKYPVPSLPIKLELREIMEIDVKTETVRTDTSPIPVVRTESLQPAYGDSPTRTRRTAPGGINDWWFLYAPAYSIIVGVLAKNFGLYVAPIGVILFLALAVMTQKRAYQNWERRQEERMRAEFRRLRNR